MFLSVVFFLQYVFLFATICFFNDGFSQVVAPDDEHPVAATVCPARQPGPETTTRPRSHHRFCACRRYRCSCCLNLSFIRRWKALVSRPMPFCKRLHLSLAEACLVIYNVKTDTPHDITVCLYLELRVGSRPVATVHLDCIRKIHRRIHFIPITTHTRKGSLLDVHVLPNDTTLTILRQEFHWSRDFVSDSESESESKSESKMISKLSESDSGLDSESDSNYEAIIIKSNHQEDVVPWFKRLFNWWQYYHQDF